MQSVVRWSLKNRSVVFLATLILVVSGAYATTRLNQELVPQVEFPLVTVSTPVPGAGPDLVDEQVTQEIEGAVEGVEGIEALQSTSSQGFSLVIVEFGFEVDTKEAETDVASALEGVALPQQALEPEVARQSFSQFPILNISLSAGDGDLARVTEYAENEAVPLIEEVEGVASADLVGGAEKQVAVELDPGKLEDRGLSADAVVGAISGAAVNAPAGAVRIEGLSTPVRATNGPVNARALENLPVGVEGAPSGAPTGVPAGGAPSGVPSGAPEGAAPGGVPGGAPAGAPPAGAAPPSAASEAPEPVTLGQVAEVREVEADLSGISRTNGEPSLGINVVKEADANTVEVAAGVEEALDEARADLGDDGVIVVSNTAEAVEESVNGLVEKALIGGLLAVAIIFAFLRSLRATLVTAVSLPTSILAALLFSWGYDLTLNIITLAGLTIAVGRVVDDAIVVLENAYRYIQQGFDPEEAALKGTTEVASAITSSTLTTVAVFLPLGLVGGIVSEFLLPLALTVTFALLASLLVAVTIIPVLVSIFIKRRGPRGDEPSSQAAEAAQEDGRFTRLYVSALRWSLGHRLVVALFAFVVFAGGLAVAPFLGATFFPQSEERLLQADVELAPGTALGETSGELRPFEDFLLDDPGVKDYQISAGGEDSSGDSESPQRADNQAQAFVTVRETADVGRTLDRVGDEGKRLYGQDFQVQVVQNGPPAGGLEITITGGTEEEFGRASDLIVGELSDKEGLANVESDLSETSPEIVARLDDGKAAEAGLSSAQVPTTLGTLLGGGGGSAAQTIEVGDQALSVSVPEESADSLEEVRELPLGSGTSVSDVAEVEEVEAPAEISRVDGERAVTVTGDITAEDTGAVNTEVQNALNRLDLPEGVEAALGGESEDIAESFRNLFISIAVALVLVYLILVVFFRSLTVPLVILLSVPLITSGSFGALLATGTPVSLPALLGILLLIGIVVSNAILIVDFAQNLRDRYATVDEAIVEAGRERLRPILMTALATIFALLPLALGISFTGSGGGGGLISSSLAIPVVGGLVTSTLLTLFVVPVGYSLLKAGRRRNEGEGQAERRSDEERRSDPVAAGEPGATEDGAATPARPAVPSDGNPEGPSDGAPNAVVAVRDEEARRERQEEMFYELGRARGRAEVLERELERRVSESTNGKHNGSSDDLGGLLRRLLR